MGGMWALSSYNYFCLLALLICCTMIAACLVPSPARPPLRYAVVGLSDEVVIAYSVRYN